jgi:hypothetical protein
MNAEDKSVSLAGIGMILGTAIGAVLGNTFGNIEFGIAMGAIVGLLFAPTIKKKTADRLKLT